MCGTDIIIPRTPTVLWKQPTVNLHEEETGLRETHQKTRSGSAVTRWHHTLPQDFSFKPRADQTESLLLSWSNPFNPNTDSIFLNTWLRLSRSVCRAAPSVVQEWILRLAQWTCQSRREQMLWFTHISLIWALQGFTLFSSPDTQTKKSKVWHLNLTYGWLWLNNRSQAK